METDSAKGKKSERQVSETTQKIMQAADFVSVVLQYLGV
jgi:hypothetical protein